MCKTVEAADLEKNWTYQERKISCLEMKSNGKATTPRLRTNTEKNRTRMIMTDTEIAPILF